MPSKTGDSVIIELILPMSCLDLPAGDWRVVCRCGRAQGCLYFTFYQGQCFSLASCDQYEQCEARIWNCSPLTMEILVFRTVSVVPRSLHTGAVNSFLLELYDTVSTYQLSVDPRVIGHQLQPPPPQQLQQPLCSVTRYIIKLVK